MNRRRPDPAAALLALALAVLAPVALTAAPAQAAPAKPRASAKASAKRKAVVVRRKSGKGGNSLAFARAYKRYREQQLILHTGPVTGPMYRRSW